MGFIAWIVFGALAGWAANVVVGGRDRQRQGCLVSILVGVVGAALGSPLAWAMTGFAVPAVYLLFVVTGALAV